MKVIIKSNKDIIAKAKAIAKKNGTSLSLMVENHLRTLLKMPVLKITKSKKVIV